MLGCSTLRPSTAFVATPRAVLPIRHGDREQGIGRVRVGFLRQVVGSARRRLVAALATSGRAAEVVAALAGRLVVVERVVELGASNAPPLRAGPSGGIQLSPRSGARSLTSGSSLSRRCVGSRVALALPATVPSQDPASGATTTGGLATVTVRERP